MEWSNAKQLLAVAGTVKRESYDGKNYVYENAVKFYTACGHHLYTARIPCKNSPVSAITWGHSDKRLFIATGNQVHIAWVSRRVAALQLLCSLQVQTSLGSEALLPMLPLPIRIKSLIYDLYAQTIRVCANATFDFRWVLLQILINFVWHLQCCVPNSRSLREFVSRPPGYETRLHCTMIRHDEESAGAGVCYTLYLEYLGGLVPLLKGKKTSKIRPEFVIFDPQVARRSPNVRTPFFLLLMFLSFFHSEQNIPSLFAEWLRIQKLWTNHQYQFWG